MNLTVARFFPFFGKSGAGFLHVSGHITQTTNILMALRVKIVCGAKIASGGEREEYEIKYEIKKR